MQDESINSRLARNFRDIGHTMRRVAEGRGSQKRILMIIREAQHITQSELTERLRIQPGSASEVIGKMDAAGLIVRTPSETDRRTTDVRLTASGEIAAEEALRQRKERHEQMFVCLTDAEKETLLELLEKVNAAWEQQYARQDANPGRGRGRHGRNREE